MFKQIGEALAGFHTALGQFEGALEAFPGLAAPIFAESGEWRDLLAYKLLPHLGDDACLVVAVTGGTNTGKSTVFNLLLGKDTSPVRITAAATCRPVLAANQRRFESFSSAQLLAPFKPVPLVDPEAVLTQETAEDALFVTVSPNLPDSYVLLDTPDVDSIELSNWEVADHIRAAGDALIAVLTAEKYKDARVVDFFREAHRAGRMIIPLMNKAWANKDFAAARTQLEDFVADTGISGAAAFVLVADPEIEDHPEAFTARRLGEGADGITSQSLVEYLGGLDVQEIKHRVYRKTLQHFALRASAFLGTVEEHAGLLERAAMRLEQLAADSCAEYRPQPGIEIGLLLHEFVQSKRGRVGKAVGAASRTLVHVGGAGARWIGRKFFAQTALDKAPAAPRDDEADRIHRETVKAMVHGLIREYYQAAEHAPELSATLLRGGLEKLDADIAVEKVYEASLRAKSISADFRQHAHGVMETWWTEEKTQRMMVEVVDRTLMVAPAAIVLYTVPGTGIAEAAAAASSSLLEQVAIRALLYQFGGRMVRLIGPWQEEQRVALRAALAEHVHAAATAELRAAVHILRGEAVGTLRERLNACTTA